MLQIDFNAAFLMDSYQGIILKLCLVDVGGSVLFILAHFLSNRSQHVKVDGCRSKIVNVVSGVPQASVSSFTPRSCFKFCRIGCSAIRYSTLMAFVPSLGLRVTVAQSLKGDLGKVSE